MDHGGLCIRVTPTAPTLPSFIILSLISSSMTTSHLPGVVGGWPHIGLSSGPVISPWLTSEGRSWKGTTEWCGKKTTNLLTAKPTFLMRVQQCQLPFLSISHPLNHHPHHRPLHDESRTNLLTPILSPRPARFYFQPERAREGYLQKSWQTIVFTVFVLRANKGGAVIASDDMKNHFMIPIYNSRLNNDPVKSWQAVINEGSYKTYLEWRLAGDEWRSDTNSW